VSRQDNPLVAMAQRIGRTVWPALQGVRRGAEAVRATVWPILKLAVRRLFEVLFALILIFEEWGWRPLAAALARLAQFPIVARLEALIVALPPYGALAVFLLPSLLILPLKLLAVFLIAAGHAVSAALLFVGAKVAGTAIVARLFMLTQPKLMQIEWFARLYNWLMPWKDRAFAAIRASWAWRYGRIVKYRIGNVVCARWLVVRPQLLQARDRVMAQVRALMGR
jgi:hypothetical protein